MGLDMYMFIDGVREGGPVVLPILAWSHGMSSSASAKYDEPLPYKESDAASDTWTTEQVIEWLKTTCKVDDKICEAFRANDVSGQALLSLTDDDFKELIPQIGTRRRVEWKRRDLLDAYQRKTSKVEEDKSSQQLHIQDISVTFYMGGITNLALMQNLLKVKTLPRAVVAVYTSSNRRNRWGNDDDDAAAQKWKLPPGTCTQLIDFRDVIVTSLSTGGSGGEDNLTLNASFNSKTFVSHISTSLEFRDVSWKLHGARLLHGSNPQVLQQILRNNEGDWNTDPDAPVPRLGVTVRYNGKNTTPDVYEWGPHVTWSPRSHSVYPEEFRKAVRASLLCAHRPECVLLHKLPKDVVFLVFSRLAKHYSANPLEEYPYPNPEALVPKELKEDGADE